MMMDKTFLDGKELCIYCNGTYGHLTYLHLRDLGIPVSYFADADRKKLGYALDHVNCISYEALLEKDRESTIVLVCKKNPEELIAHFRGEGFSQTYSYKEIEKLERTHPVIDLDGETVERINDFRKGLYQIYYQNKGPIRWDGTKNAFTSELERILEDAWERRRRDAV